MINWPGAIERNRDALLRIVQVLFIYAGLDEGGADVLPRRVWRMIVRLLRPAESAARRLIVIAARGIEVEVPRPRAERAPTAIEQLQAAGLLVIHEGINLGLARAPRNEAPVERHAAEPRIPAFLLVDPRRRFDSKARDGMRPFPQGGFELAEPDEEVSARHLCRRLHALMQALDDLPGQAKRLARWRARRDLAFRATNARSDSGGPPPKLPGAKQGYRRISPMRPGRPPGFRKRASHAVDDVLRECHSLAVRAQSPPDSPSVNHSN